MTHQDRVRKLEQFVRQSTVKSLSFHCAGVEESVRLAQEFASLLKPGDVLALEGDLGSGKTTFVKGIALGLGAPNPDEVKSPTFVLMHMYLTKIPLYHFDLYRLDREEDIQSIGFEDFVTDPQAIVCVEWAQKALSFFPPQTYWVHFRVSGETSREIAFSKKTG